MIKNILFDLDNTLFDFNTSEKKALTETLVHLGVTPDEKILTRYSEINLAHWKLLEQDKLTRDEVKIGRYRQLFDEFNIKASPQETTRYYESRLACRDDLTSGAYELLQKLYGKYRLFVVSNGTLTCQQGRLKNSGISGFFDGFFISQQIGYEKPAKEFFDYCFRNISGFSRDETIIVGDSISADISGGKNAGIKTVWFNPDHETSHIKPDFEIHALSELNDLLERM